MNILITGANGQLGSELAKVLSIKKSEIGSISKTYNDATVICADVDNLDIADCSQVFNFVNKSKADVIINCAAYTNVDACETNKEAAFKVNALGPRNLAMAAEKAGAKLVHISTDYVFAGNGVVPYAEWDICNPQSVYGKTKYLGEQYVRELCSKYFIVRTAWLYGYSGSNFVKTIIKAAKERGELKVVNDQKGNPTNAADLAHHVLKIADTQEYGLYHCTGNGECSWFDFASKIVEYSKIECKVRPCTTNEFPRPAKRPAYSSLDNIMLRCTVGDEMRNWEEALKSFINNIKN